MDWGGLICVFIGKGSLGGIWCEGEKVCKVYINDKKVIIGLYFYYLDL